jgi:hypothetical protein
MKILHTITAAALSLIFLQANAQNEIPKGFKRGTLVHADGSTLSGLIKDNIRNNASVLFISEAGGKKMKYDGSELISAEMEGTKFICIRGDFFKVLCEGELSFLQKASDASGKPVYNGNVPVFSNGTEGSPNDYFIYHNENKQLKLISKKNVDDVAAASFAGYTAAIDKAKTINGDLSLLKDAIALYNSRNR